MKEKVAVSAGAWYRATAVDYGSFGFYGIPAPGHDPDAIEAAIDECIADVLENGVTEEEVAQARQRLRAGLVYARDSSQSAARTIGAALATGSTLEDVQAWPRRIAAVTRDQVIEAARTVLKDSQFATGVLLPGSPEETAALPEDAPVPGVTGGSGAPVTPTDAAAGSSG